MINHHEQRRPEPWAAYREKHKKTLLRPVYALNWLLAWLAHFLSGWVLLEVLDYLGTFSILIAVIFYFAESGDRLKQKHYQAWQVINTAQGKGGSGGRIDALEQLNADQVPLVGVDLSDAFLYGIQLAYGRLARSTFDSADLRGCSFESATLTYATFDKANLRDCNLKHAKLTHANLENADLTGADLSAADLAGASLDLADFRNTDLSGVKLASAASARLANFFGARNLPADFAVWAKRSGAVQMEDTGQWNTAQAAAAKNSHH
jgi:hypothetical protein